MLVTIVKDSHGWEQVHRAGCADIKKRGNRLGDAWTADFSTLEDLYASYWDCIADEAVANDPETYPTLRHAYYAWQGEFNVLPCASALTEMDDPDSEPSATQGEEIKMDAAQHKAHRTEAMRKPDVMEACLSAHGVTDIPAARTARIKLHDEVCKPDAGEPQADAQPQPEPQPEPAKPASRTRTRKPAQKAAPQPEAKDEPAQTGKPELGIPYAKLEVKGRNLVATCPECGKTFVEKADATGELTTDNYGTHYASEHKKADKPEPAKRTRKPAAKQEPAKPAARTRKPAAKPAPAKPATRGRKPAQDKPATPPAAANGTSPRVHKQELARELVNLVAGHFAKASAEDRERISYWLRGLPTGNPAMPGTVGGHLRWWPEDRLPRPAGKDWYAPAE